MSDSDLLADSVARALADAVEAKRTVECEAAGVDAKAQRALEALGLAGADAATLGFEAHLAIARAIGHAGALVGYADREALGRWLALGAGFEVADRDTVVPVIDRERRVPWVRGASHLALAFSRQGRDHVALVPAQALSWEAGANLAGEPRDRLVGALDGATVEAHEVPSEFSPAAVMRRGALLRCAAMAGAADRIQAMTLQYAADRRQFGRPIAQFQVIQAYLAQLVGETVAMSAMLSVAARAVEDPARDATWEVAAAKVRAGQAAQSIAALAHQVHGAMGFTQDYPLHLWTRRLWAWREEWGGDTHWARELGTLASRAGPEAYWERLTT